MKITHIKVSNYRGIAALEADIPAAGVIAQGRNGAGKTSVLRALQAALAARDVGPDAIRIGADKAEILVNLDDLTVRRLITPKSTSVSVETAAGDVKKKPQTVLTELLGTSPLDPLDFFLAAPKKRIELVVAAVPTVLSDEQLDEWLPTWALSQLPTEATKIGGRNGLEACDGIYQALYARRADANKAVAAKKGDADRNRAALGKRREAIRETIVLTPTDAEQKLIAAREAHADLQARAKRVVVQQESTAAARKKIEDYRTRSAAAKAEAESATARAAGLDAKRAEIAAIDVDIAELERKLARARDLRVDLAMQATELQKFADGAKEAEARADELEAQASELALAIEDLVEDAPTAEQVAASAETVRVAEAARETALEVAAIVAGEKALEAELADLEASEKTASDLSDLVDFWRAEAPKKLLAAAKGIDGLTIEGDKILLDGVAIDALSGREQMRFAVDLARRLNAKTKLLVVDGLERLDPDQFEEFVRFATADGFQLVGTRVDRGEVKLIAVEPTESAEAAQ